jgi:hypothetical protein
MENSSTRGSLGSRVVAWIIVLAIAVLAIKVVFGIVAGFVMALLWAAALVLVVMAALWALRHL